MGCNNYADYVAKSFINGRKRNETGRHLRLLIRTLMCGAKEEEAKQGTTGTKIYILQQVALIRFFRSPSDAFLYGGQ